MVPTVPTLPLAPVVAFGHRREDRKVKKVVSLQDDVGVKLGVYLGVERVVTWVCLVVLAECL